MGRFVAQLLLALLTLASIVLGQSIFWSGGVSSWMKAIVVLIAIISFFRPSNGLLLLAALTPFGQLIKGLLNSDVRGGEAMVLAFLAGALLHDWTLGEFRAIRWNTLKLAVTFFAAVVVASCIEQLWFSQLQTDYVSRYVDDLAVYIHRGYLTSLGGYGMVFNTMLFVEGLALLLYTASYCRRDPDFAPRLVRMVVLGALGGALANITFAIAEIAELGEPAARFAGLFVSQRWSTQVGDVNTAGSFFAMTAIIALGMALKDRSNRFAWTISGFLLLFALLMTSSRSALVAVWVVLVAWLIRVIVVKHSTKRWLAFAALAVLIAAPVVVFQYFRGTPFVFTAALAVNIRWWFLETTWRMLEWQPLFGVGIGRYFLWSSTFSPPELRVYYLRENAHNNFAQVAGELGLVGLVAFVFVLGACFLPATRRLWDSRFYSSDFSRTYVTPVVAGLAAFILSWLGGHPLLVPEIAYPFWLTLATIAGLNFAPPSARSVVSAFTRITSIAFVAFPVILAGSIPIRVNHKLLAIDLSRVDYGFVRSPGHHIGHWPRRIDSRARIFVPVRAHDVSIRVRSPSASFDQSEELVIRVNGSEATRVRLNDAGWHAERVSLPNRVEGRFHEVDLEPVDHARVDVGGWEIISGT